jgi:hypothetical protein
MNEMRIVAGVGGMCSGFYCMGILHKPFLLYLHRYRRKCTYCRRNLVNSFEI